VKPLIYVNLFTVGTSILSNFVRSGFRRDLLEKYADRRVGDWYRLPPQDEEQRFIESLRRGVDVYDALVDYVDKDPRAASAELNAFYGFMGRWCLPYDAVEVYIYSTDTGTCWLCSRVIHDHLRRMGVKAQEPIRVKGWGLEDFERGLANLLDKMAGIISSKKRQGCRVFVNATGGFKPESTFAVLAASLLGADGVYYMHEAFKDIVYIPILPLTVEKSYVKTLKKLGYWMPKRDAEELLRMHGYSLRDLEEMRLIEERDGKVIVKKWVRKLMAKASR